MSIYKIVDLNIKMKPLHNPLKTQIKPYLTKDKFIDHEIPNIEKEVKEYHKTKPHLSIGEAEYIMYGSYFYTLLIKHQAILLHSSAVTLNNETYLFSAPSGTGKSTHAKLWLKVFKDAYILNDDKPALKFKNKKLYAYGTPFSGKTNLNVNTKSKVKAIYFIERSKNNWIKKLNSKDALTYLLSETVRSKRLKLMSETLLIIENIIKTIPIYKMGINISKEAVIMAYNEVNKGETDED